MGPVSFGEGFYIRLHMYNQLTIFILEFYVYRRMVWVAQRILSP